MWECWRNSCGCFFELAAAALIFLGRGFGYWEVHFTFATDLILALWCRLNDKKETMAKGRLIKEFEQYLIEEINTQVSHRDYTIAPAVAFLKHTIKAKSSIDLCIRNLPRNKNKEYAKGSKDAIQHLTISVLPTIMGHFETYQKYLFAGMFDLSVYILGFDVKKFLDKTTKDVSIDLERLAAFRNIGTSSIGFVIADNLKGWHSPEKVNSYFNAFSLNHQFFPIDDIKRIKVLWQLRHSIVHTGGTITLPDSEKITELNQWGDKTFVFQENFIYEVARKLHPIVKRGTEGLGTGFKSKLKPNLNSQVTNRIDTFFEVRSSIPVWL